MFYKQIKNIFITKKIMVEVYDKLYFVCVYQYLMFCRVQHHLYTNKKNKNMIGTIIVLFYTNKK